MAFIYEISHPVGSLAFGAPFCSTVHVLSILPILREDKGLSSHRHWASRAKPGWGTLQKQALTLLGRAYREGSAGSASEKPAKDDVPDPCAGTRHGGTPRRKGTPPVLTVPLLPS